MATAGGRLIDLAQIGWGSQIPAGAGDCVAIPGWGMTDQTHGRKSGANGKNRTELSRCYKGKIALFPQLFTLHDWYGGHGLNELCTYIDPWYSRPYSGSAVAHDDVAHSPSTQIASG